MRNRCFQHLELARDTMYGGDMEGEKEIIGSWVNGMEWEYKVHGFHNEGVLGTMVLFLYKSILRPNFKPSF